MVRSWTRAEYDRLIDIGFFDEDEPIELLGGQLVVREPQLSAHATATQLVAEALRATFGVGFHVRCGLPIALDEESEPEPDVCVVPGRARDYRDAHPSRPVLVVEIALSSLALDRHVKGSLYARAGLADYWIVNLPERQVEVHRQPIPDPSAPHGWRYAHREVVRPATRVSPLAAPAASVDTTALLP